MLAKIAINQISQFFASFVFASIFFLNDPLVFAGFTYANVVAVMFATIARGSGCSTLTNIFHDDKKDLSIDRGATLITIFVIVNSIITCGFLYIVSESLNILEKIYVPLVLAITLTNNIYSVTNHALRLKQSRFLFVCFPTLRWFLSIITILIIDTNLIFYLVCAELITSVLLFLSFKPYTKFTLLQLQMTAQVYYCDYVKTFIHTLAKSINSVRDQLIAGVFLTTEMFAIFAYARRFLVPWQLATNIVLQKIVISTKNAVTNSGKNGWLTVIEDRIFVGLSVIGLILLGSLYIGEKNNLVPWY